MTLQEFLRALMRLFQRRQSAMGGNDLAELKLAAVSFFCTLSKRHNLPLLWLGDPVKSLCGSRYKRTTFLPANFRIHNAGRPYPSFGTCSRGLRWCRYHPMRRLFLQGFLKRLAVRVTRHQPSSATSWLHFVSIARDNFFFIFNAFDFYCVIFNELNRPYHCVFFVLCFEFDKPKHCPLNSNLPFFTFGFHESLLQKIRCKYFLRS